MPETIKLTAHTALAVEQYGRIRRAERRLEKLHAELRGYVLGIEGDEQMAEYVRLTTAIDEA